jgi:molybdopterin molybdotransferase
MPVAKARELIGTFLVPISDSIRVPVRDALGRILSRDVVSPMDVPAHRNSAMDGYAIRHADLASAGDTSLRIVGSAFAGVPYAGVLRSAECVRIMTGAIVPDGADSIVMQERVVVEGQCARVGPGHKLGQHVRQAGEDLRAGGVALDRGHRVRAADLGLVASLGIGEVEVVRPLRVAIFSTGDELVSLGQALAPGQIYDSNRYTLYGMLTRLGVEVLDLGVVRDDPTAIEAAFAGAAAMADVIITSGGVSVGEADFVKQMLNKLGQVLFWKIAMKPGRPLAYGKIGAAHFFGLPGNPVAVMVTFYQFVRAALLRLMGSTESDSNPTFKALCSTPIKKAPGRTEFQRGILSPTGDGIWSVRVTGDQGSGILRSMSEANCFIILGASQGDLPAGSSVDVQILEGII